MTLHPFLAGQKVLAFAHRGGVEDGPENTMRAFQGAVDLGYRAIETDVHVTRDGVALAFHDDRLDRVTDRRGVIAELDFGAVKEARVGGTEKIPLLDDVLGTWPDLRVNLDPKHDAAVEAIARALERTQAFHRVCVGSFSGARLVALRKRFGPKLCTSLGPSEVVRLQLISRGLRFGSFDANCAQVPVSQSGIPVVTPRFLAAAHAREIKVHVWTIDDPREMERLLDLGVDGLMTDRPRVLKQVLSTRGLW